MKIRTLFHGGTYRHVLAGSMLLASLIIGASASSPVFARGDTTPPPNTFNQRLQARLLTKMQEMRVPGAIVFVQSARTGSWETNLGISDIATHAPMNPDMHFRIGSITKTLTGTVILQLAQEGKLRLDDPVAKYQPKVPDGANITLRELLDMKSGLYNYSEDSTFIRQVVTDPTKAWTPQDLLAVSFKHRANAGSNRAYSYSNTNFILLGMIIEQVTGQPAEQVFQQRIFTPLGMTQTSLPARTDAAIPAPYAQGYILSQPDNQNDRNFSGKPIDVTEWNPSWDWTAGSAISTLHDLQIWAKALAIGQLLSPSMQRERIAWHMTGSGGVPYGLAIANFDGFIGYNGQIPGYQSFAAYLPERNETVVVLTNLYAAPDNSLPADELAKIIVQALAPGTPVNERPPQHDPPPQHQLPPSPQHGPVNDHPPQHETPPPQHQLPPSPQHESPPPPQRETSPAPVNDRQPLHQLPPFP